jgi:hypothetical protein
MPQRSETLVASAWAKTLGGAPLPRMAIQDEACNDLTYAHAAFETADGWTLLLALHDFVGTTPQRVRAVLRQGVGGDSLVAHLRIVSPSPQPTAAAVA